MKEAALILALASTFHFVLEVAIAVFWWRKKREAEEELKAARARYSRPDHS